MVKLALPRFYKRATWGFLGLETLTSLGTFGKYGHVDLIFYRQHGTYRATATTTYGAVVELWKPDPNLEAYDFIELPADFPEELAWEQAHKEDDGTPLEQVECEDGVVRWINKKGGYDWRGIISFMLPFIKPHKTRWFCSERVAFVLSVWEPLKFLEADEFKFSPNRLARAVRAALAKPRPVAV